MKLFRTGKKAKNKDSYFTKIKTYTCGNGLDVNAFLEHRSLELTVC